MWGIIMCVLVWEQYCVQVCIVSERVSLWVV